MVTIDVGPDAEQFTAHAHLLSSDSDYFRAAFEGKWEEAVMGHFKLSEEHPAVFAMYLDWLYNHKITCKDTNDVDVLLVELYLLGERRQSSKFCNATIDKMHAVWVSSREISLEAITLSFDDTSETSKLRTLIVDKCAWEMHPAMLLEQLEDINGAYSEFVLGLSRAILGRMLLSREDSTVGRCTTPHKNHTWGCASIASCQSCRMSMNMQHVRV